MVPDASRSARAKPNDRPADVPAGCENEVEIVLGQRKLLQRLVPGLMHAFIFWGFLVLFPTIVMAMIAAVDKHAELPWLGGQTWFGWMVDIFVVLVLAGVVDRGLHPQGRAAGAVPGLAPRRGRRHPLHDRGRRHDASLLARGRARRRG